MGIHREPYPDEYDSNNDHIDVCVRCGSYFGHTTYLLTLWHKHHHPRDGDIMPQLCSRCMKE